MAVFQLKKRCGGAARIAGAVEDAVPYMRAAAEQLPELVSIVAPVAKKVTDITSDRVPEALKKDAGRIAGAAMEAGQSWEAQSAPPETLSSTTPKRAPRMHRQWLSRG